MSTLREVPPEVERLQRLIEAVKFGTITITVQNGKAIRAERVIESIKLDQPDEFEKSLRIVQL